MRTGTLAYALDIGGSYKPPAPAGTFGLRGDSSVVPKESPGNAGGFQETGLRPVSRFSYTF